MVTGKAFADTVSDYARHTAADDDEMRALKTALMEALTEAERNTLVLYCELGSLQQLATRLAVSKTTAAGEVARIREKVKVYMNRRGYEY